MESGSIQELLMSLFKSSSIFENMDFDTLWGLLTSMYDISIQGSEVC